jgi:hypothetical protein
MDLPDIELTESITGEAILPRDVDDRLTAQRAVAATPQHAIIRVKRGHGNEWPIVERVPGGWQSGAHHYPDRDVVNVKPLHVFTDEHLRQHDAEERATALEERARWIRGGSRETYPRDEVADWLDASARRHRKIGGAS